MTVAVTSATGYPGSHMILTLQDAAEPWLAIDEAGQAIPDTDNSDCRAEIDIRNAEKLATLLKCRGVREVIHFAGGGTVPQSMGNPLACYEQNVVRSYSLIRACVLAGVERLVMSSTSSVYGQPERMPISEVTRLNPISPYGSSMMMAERMVSDIARVNRMGLVILRYFNIAGADPKGRAGETGKPTNLFKVISQIAAGTRNESLQIYGADYPTPDGTCIRDYLHVSDMAAAHLAAMVYLREGRQSTTLNCGYGHGLSVLEIIASAERVTGRKIPVEYAQRREGDPPQLIADNAAIRATLDWTPQFENVDYIMRTAIDWESKSRQIAA